MVWVLFLFCLGWEGEGGVKVSLDKEGYKVTGACQEVTLSCLYVEPRGSLGLGGLAAEKQLEADPLVRRIMLLSNR